MKKLKIMIVSILFYIVGVAITFGMFKLWFWLFQSKIWLTIFVAITLIGSAKYFWQHTHWTLEKISEK